MWTSGTLALGLPLLSVAGLMLYNLAFYGSPSPTAPYEGPTLFTGNPLGGLVGQLFAQGQGALGTAPFVLLAIPGAVALWRRDRATALKIGLATLPFWLVTLTYRDWWGGDAPPLRYLLPFLPLWATGIAALLAGLRTASIGVGRWSKVRCAPHEVGGYASPNSLPPTSYSRLAGLAVAALAGVTLALTLAIPAAPRLGWPLPDGAGGLLLSLGHHLGLPLASWLPAFEPTRTGPGLWHNAWLIAPWAAVLLMAWALLAYQARRRQTYD